MFKSRRLRVLAATLLTIHGQALEILLNNGCWGLSNALVLRPRISPRRESDKAKNRPEGRFPDFHENGADDGIRTRDPHLGKVMLYQLSHVREENRF